MSKKFITGWIDLSPLIDTGCKTLIACGGRRNGKTYGALMDGLDRCRTTGKGIVFVRNKDKQIAWAKSKTLLVEHDDICRDIFGEIPEYNRQTHQFTVGDRAVMTVVSLESFYSWKGVNFKDFSTVIYEEFLDDTTNDDTVAEWLNMLKTIVSTRDDVRVWMLSNSILRNNAFFRAFKIDGSKLRQGHIHIVQHVRGFRCAIYYTPYKADDPSGQVVDEYVGLDDNDTATMIMYGEWEHPPFEMREIDGISWAAEREIFPYLFFINGHFHEISVTRKRPFVAFERIVNTNTAAIGEWVQGVITDRFDRTFRTHSGRVVPKYGAPAGLNSTGTRILQRFLLCEKQCRIVTVSPIDLYEFLTWLKSVRL